MSMAWTKKSVGCVLVSWCLVLVLLLVPNTQGFKIRVAARSEECVYESAKVGQFVNVNFQVLEGGNQDIDIKFSFSAKNAPNGVERLILMAQRKTEEKYTFPVDQEGEFKFCFGNLMSVSSPKMINVATSVTMARSAVQEEFIDPLEEVARQLISSVQVVRDEQTMFKQRDIVTSNLSEATNGQVLWYSMLEIVALLLAVAYQIYNIKTMFEVKQSL